MRQIKFRGLDSNGVWHYGNLLQSKPFKDGRIDCWIQPKTLLTLGANSTPTTAFVKVIEKTVGQIIDDKDSDGVVLFEGDIVKMCWGQDFDGVNYYRNHAIVYKRNRWALHDCANFWAGDQVQKTGNIHQNPELLESKNV